MKQKVFRFIFAGFY